MMTNQRAYELAFLALSLTGFTLLWLLMAYNGTLVALLKAAWTGVFADGRPLRSSYTGFFPIDFAIAVLVAFYDSQTDGQDAGTWIFIFNFLIMLQTAGVWVLVEGNRRGVMGHYLTISWLWPLLWNLFGAAIILPLYFSLHIRSMDPVRLDPMISTGRGRSFIPLTTIIGFVPMVAMHLGYVLSADTSRQIVTACFPLSPILSVIVEKFIFPASKKTREREDEVDNVGKIYLVTGLLCAGFHLYTMAVALFSLASETAFSRMFIPSPSNVVSGNPDILREGGLLFLQYDWWIVNISCAMWIYLLVERSEIVLRVGKGVRALAILVAMLVFGPGATMNAALWAREWTLRAQFQHCR
ncbi:hypothetical protein BJX63DRAFT_115353 [Aspergillus granulosus]|uniref:Uncharacterized protein n=1 Tax=Aspergillus granulosus TaxID=176169 RepID=A0ABR4GTK1_9EURO